MGEINYKKTTIYSKPEYIVAFFVPRCVLFRVLFQLGKTVSANVFAFVIDNVSSLVAENAGRLILFEQDVLIVNIDLDRILFVDVERASQLDRQNDSCLSCQFF